MQERGVRACVWQLASSHGIEYVLSGCVRMRVCGSVAVCEGDECQKCVSELVSAICQSMTRRHCHFHEHACEGPSSRGKTVTSAVHP